MRTWSFVVVLALLVILFMAIPAQAAQICDSVKEIPEAECLSLTTLYNNTNGANWKEKEGWLVTNTPCNWYGLICSDGHVIRLSLSYNNLNGMIPPELGNLTALQLLHLGDNKLSGPFPVQLSNLTNLQSLHLPNNQLSGNLPASLGNLINLYRLDLSSNQLTGNIPPTLGNLTSLKGLVLSKNQLSGPIPIELGKLTKLQDIDLAFNQLNGNFPTQLSNLVTLQRLSLFGNQFTGNIPSSLSKLGNLQELYLNNNQLSGKIPAELGNLTQLQDLTLNNNQLSGNIPAQLGDLGNLQRLELHNNQLSGNIPTALGNLQNLQTLFLYNNRLDSTIPATLGNLLNLQLFYLQNNALTGEIPKEITHLTELAQANFAYNKLTATDAGVIDFLNSKDPDWNQTQTVPPTHVQAFLQSNYNVQLTWQPISYTGNGGYYEISYGTTPGGPYPTTGITAAKTDTSYLIQNLPPNITYYFVVRTYTPAHDEQHNDLWSNYSQEVSFAIHADISSISVIKQASVIHNFRFMGDLGNFTLTPGIPQTFSNLVPATYTISEDPTSFPDRYWTLLSVTCTNQANQLVAVNVDLVNFKATVPLSLNQQLTCIFHNERANFEESDEEQLQDE